MHTEKKIALTLEKIFQQDADCEGTLFSHDVVGVRDVVLTLLLLSFQGGEIPYDAVPRPQGWRRAASFSLEETAAGVIASHSCLPATFTF